MAVPKPVRVGHLVIRVRDVAKSVKWYEDVIGLKVTDWRPPYLREGEVVNAQGLGDFVFMTAEAMSNSHELVIAPVAADAAGPDDKAVGMAHFAWMVGSLPALEQMYAHLQEIGQPLVAGRVPGVGAQEAAREPGHGDGLDPVFARGSPGPVVEQGSERQPHRHLVHAGIPYVAAETGDGGAGALLRADGREPVAAPGNDLGRV